MRAAMPPSLHSALCAPHMACCACDTGNEEEAAPLQMDDIAVSQLLALMLVG